MIVIAKILQHGFAGAFCSCLMVAADVFNIVVHSFSTWIASSEHFELRVSLFLLFLSETLGFVFHDTMAPEFHRTGFGLHHSNS